MKASQNFTKVYFPRVILLASLLSQLVLSSHWGSIKVCADPPVFAYGTQAEVRRAHCFSWRSTGSGLFLLYSEPISSFSQTSALGERDLNESLLGRVNFLQTPVLVFLGMMWHQECWEGIWLILSSVNYSAVLGFGLILTCFLYGSSCFFATERHHVEVLFLLFSLIQWV